MCIFKKYKDIFGQPGTGAHSWRFLGVAGVDFFLTFIVACLTTYFTKIPLVITTVGWFILAMLVHILFGVQTSTLTWLGFKCN